MFIRSISNPVFLYTPLNLYSVSEYTDTDTCSQHDDDVHDTFTSVVEFGPNQACSMPLYSMPLLKYIYWIRRRSMTPYVLLYSGLRRSGTPVLRPKEIRYSCTPAQKKGLCGCRHQPLSFEEGSSCQEPPVRKYSTRYRGQS